MLKTAENLATKRSARRGVVGFLTAMAGALTLGAAAATAAWQTPESIRAAARELVLDTLGRREGLTVEAVAVDERLKLPACDAPLEARAQGALRSGQGTVAVSCAAPSPWRLFVPVRAVEQVPVLVAARSLRAGERLAADDVVLTSRASTTLPYDYVASVDAAVGSTLRRALPAGAVLVPAAIEAPRVIERGALVTLVSGAGPVQVTTEGVALAPAAAGQRVRVRSPSGRVVEGTAGAAGEVRVGR
jgi:flagella basal body P-ring formation protein FlgA